MKKQLKFKGICVFLCLVILCLSFSPVSVFASTSPKFSFNSDISIIDTWKSGDKIYFKYKLDKKFDWPSSGLVNGKMYLKVEYTGNTYSALVRGYTKTIVGTAKTNYSKGTHTTSIDVGDSKIVGKISTQIVFTASGGGRSVTYTKSGDQFFLHPFESMTTYHTVSKAEAIGNATFKYVIPGITFFVAPETKVIKCVSGLYLAWTCCDAVSSSLSKGFPGAVAGQYYKIENYYTSSGSLKQRFQIWNSKSNYDKNYKPVYDCTYTLYTF